jgi:hypothetical protein
MRELEIVRHDIMNYLLVVICYVFSNCVHDNYEREFMTKNLTRTNAIMSYKCHNVIQMP